MATVSGPADLSDYTRFGMGPIEPSTDDRSVRDAELMGEVVGETIAREVVNLGRMVIDLQESAESKQQNKIEDKLHEIDALHEKIDNLTSFVEHLETELGKDVKSINFSQHQDLIDKVKVHLDHELLNKNTWTRAEAEALSKAFSRRVEQVSREINPMMTAVNHMMEDRHEMLQLIREILKMYREMIQGMTRNQVSR